MKLANVFSTYRKFLPELWASVIYTTIRAKDGNVYAHSFLERQRNYTKQWIENPHKTPGHSNIRLRSQNLCSYCKTPITTSINSVGDHIVGRKMNELFWLVPCCNICNSSKGKLDLIEWWVGKKNHYFLRLDKDVISIFVRAKYRLLQKEGNLDQTVTDPYLVALNQVRNSWSDTIFGGET